MLAPTSKMEDRESPKQSDDTILSVQYPNTPFIGPSAAAFIAAHTAWVVDHVVGAHTGIVA